MDPDQLLAAADQAALACREANGRRPVLGAAVGDGRCRPNVTVCCESGRDEGGHPGMRYVDEAHHRVLAAARDMLRRGLVEGTAGNISARQQDGTLVITPAAVDYADMQLDDLVIVNADGATVSCKANRSPSSEKMLHLACYWAFDDIGSVIHSHPVHATMFAIAHQGIPACVDEFAMYVGGDVRCTEYAPSGSAEVAVQAVKALDGRGAALIANHGMVAVGPDPEAALRITALVERSARTTWGARSLGPLNPLPDAVNDRFAAYYAELRQNPL